jgi:hypothetical protein
MSKRRRRKSPTKDAGDTGAVFRELGLRDEDYDVLIAFTKSFLSGARGTVVLVTHKASGRSKKLYDVSGTKREAQRKSVEILRRCLLALLGRA